MKGKTLMARFNNSFYRHLDDARILYDITSDMVTSLTPYQMAASIHHHKTKTHLCIVDKKCFDPEQNYFLIPDLDKIPKDLHIINDADYAEEHRFEKLPLPDELFDKFNDDTKKFYRSFLYLAIRIAAINIPSINS